MLVTDTKEAKKICEEILTYPVCAVDVEFVRRNTYYPVVCLVQIAVGKEKVYLFDVYQNKDVTELAKILTGEKIVKVFHGFTQDLEALDFLCHCLPSPCFDTQLAASFCGLGYQISFAELVYKIFQENLSKFKQTSDWTIRPLDGQQLEYAQQDVLYLYRCYEVLQKRLTELQRLSWLEEETATQLSYYKNHRTFSRLDPQRIGGIGDLSPAEYTLLELLIYWRDAKARHQNLPIQWILPNRTILEIVKSFHFFSPELLPENKRDYFSEIKQIIQDFQRQRIPWKQPPNHHKRISSKEQLWIQELTNRCRKKAKEYDIPLELLAPRREIKKFILSRGREGNLGVGWRKNILGDSLSIFDEKRFFKTRSSSKGSFSYSNPTQDVPPKPN